MSHPKDKGSSSSGVKVQQVIPCIATFLFYKVSADAHDEHRPGEQTVISASHSHSCVLSWEKE